jgi:hypothetical protein
MKPVDWPAADTVPEGKTSSLLRFLRPQLLWIYSFLATWKDLDMIVRAITSWWASRGCKIEVMLRLEFCNNSPEGIQSCLVGRMLHLSSCSCVLCRVTVELLLCRFLCNFIDMFISSFIEVRAYQVSATPVVTL